VNENDATATDEITFGDNDALAAQVAVLVRAQLLVLLTSVAGVLTHAPGDERARVIADGADAGSAVVGTTSARGRGGIASKVAAAELAAAAGIPAVIAAGAGPRVLAPLLAGEALGTHFAPAATGESAFKLWLRFGKRVSGRVLVDDGARQAVVRDGRSLLAVGVVRAQGAFRAGDGVELCDAGGTPFGRGISSVDAAELEARPPQVEAVHRDRLVVY
jgi:glutamate 5-kinase